MPLTVRRRKSLALLVYLALTGRAHGREVLASLFIDQASDAQARAQFRTTLTGLVEQVGAFLLIERATQFVDAERRAQFLDSLPAHRTLVHAWRDYRRWTMGAGEHDADASVAPRAFDNRQPTPLRIVRREELS